MIGRAALGNPWIFQNIINNNDNAEFKTNNLDVVVSTCKEHIKLLVDNKSDKVSINLSKKHLSWYLKDFKNAALYRKEIMRSEDINSITKVLDSII